MYYGGDLCDSGGFGLGIIRLIKMASVGTRGRACRVCLGETDDVEWTWIGAIVELVRAFGSGSAPRV